MTEPGGRTRRGPLWLRIFAGVLIAPFLWLALILLSEALLPALLRSTAAVLVLFVIAGLGGWLAVRPQSTRMAIVCSSITAFGYVLAATIFFFGRMAPAPLAPTETERVVKEAQSRAQPPLPEFFWPPPSSASASYVLPDDLFASDRTIGAVVGAIVSALEHSGYVERSFFQTQAGGVALVARLERINDDGSSFPEPQRWPAGEPKLASTGDLIQFLRGLFFVDPGHYRVIVFILQDLPFSQSTKRISAEETTAWLKSGVNVLPPEIANRPFTGGHCTVLIYEFASDGTTVRVVDSRLTGRRHLEKSGVLSLLEQTH